MIVLGFTFEPFHIRFFLFENFEVVKCVGDRFIEMGRIQGLQGERAQ